MPFASPSSNVGRYRLLKQVGRGGLGVVWKAVDSRNGRVVALKLLTRPLDQAFADDVAARRLSREFRALAELEHRHVVRVLDAGVHDTVPYLVMEFVEGLPMRAWLATATPRPRAAPPPPPIDDDPTVSLEPPGARSNPSSLDRSVDRSIDTSPGWLGGEDEPDSLPPLPRRPAVTAPVAALVPPTLAAVADDLNQPARLARLRDVVSQLCDGLEFIHGHGLVHRDLKPSNVLVADGGCAKLVDFGLVKVLGGGGNTTAVGHVVGTWRYMSPEQARGTGVDGRSDLYGLGSVIYEQLVGEPPFVQKQPAALLDALVHEAPVPVLARNPGADPVLAGIAMRLLEKDPAERFQHASEILDALG